MWVLYDKGKLGKFLVEVYWLSKDDSWIGTSQNGIKGSEIGTDGVYTNSSASNFIDSVIV